MKTYESNGVLVKGTTILEDIISNPLKTAKFVKVLVKFGWTINTSAKADNKKVDWITKI